MPLNLAHKAACNLALTLMVTVILLSRSRCRSVIVAELDRDAGEIIHAYDPYER